MKDQKAARPADVDKETEAKEPKSTALSTDDLDQVSGGINPQPIPPGKSRVSQ